MSERQPAFSSSEELRDSMGDWTKPRTGEKMTSEESKEKELSDEWERTSERILEENSMPAQLEGADLNFSQYFDGFAYLGGSDSNTVQSMPIMEYLARTGLSKEQALGIIGGDDLKLQEVADKTGKRINIIGSQKQPGGLRVPAFDVIDKTFEPTKEAE